MGTNEYAQEEDVEPSWHVAYGPIGAMQEPSHCQEYTDSKGNRVGQAELSRLQQELWNAQRKLQQRMAKATAATGRCKTTAASDRAASPPTGTASPPSGFTDRAPERPRSVRTRIGAFRVSGFSSRASPATGPCS